MNAESVDDGTLYYVIDGRAPRPEPGREWVVSSEDMFGDFAVKDGEIVPDSYWRKPRPSFIFFTETGLLSA